jgi:hypothetical protein
VNATAIAVGVFCLLLLGCGIFLTRILWRDASTQFDADPAWWVWGEGLWGRVPRALPVLVNGFALCGLAFTPVMAEGECTGGCDYEGATAVLALLGLGLGLATIVLTLSTLLAGRPRFLIPPPVRPGRGTHRAHGNDEPNVPQPLA